MSVSGKKRRSSFDSPANSALIDYGATWKDDRSGFCQCEVSSTNWRAVIVAAVVSFLAAIENTVLGISEWPYMQKLDAEATSQFFGFASSFSKFGHAISVMIFANLSYRSQSIRIPLVAGRLIAFIACCIYLCVEFLPAGRRYLMMSCYFMFGIATSSASVLRTYMVLISTPEDRARAYSAITLSNTFSTFVGPICQLAFSAIDYPGIQLVAGKLMLHIYSAPVWFAAATNFISIAIILLVMPEVRQPRVRINTEKSLGIRQFASKLRSLRQTNLPWSLIVTCWIERIVANLPIVTVLAIGSPLIMSCFGWTGADTVRVMSVTMLAMGICSIAVAAAFAVFKLNKFISARTSYLLSVVIAFMLYVATYPYDFNSHIVSPFNSTTGAGCNPAEYSWCSTAQSISPMLFIPVVVVALGVGQPLAAISVDTIYSKILDGVEQSRMQGLMVLAEDVVLVLGPTYASALFTNYGQSTLWLWNALITAFGMALWVLFFKKFAKYE